MTAFAYPPTPSIRADLWEGNGGGNVLRMVRTADATGIALDEQLEHFSQDIREELELSRFGSSPHAQR